MVLVLSVESWCALESVVVVSGIGRICCQKISAGADYDWAALSPPLRLRRFASRNQIITQLSFFYDHFRQAMVLKDIQNRSRRITKHERKYVFNSSDLIIGRMTLSVIFM